MPEHLTRRQSRLVRMPHIRALEYPYGQSCRAVRRPIRPVSAPSCNIYQVKSDLCFMCYLTRRDQHGPRKTAYGPFYRHKIIRPCMKIVHAQLSATGNTAPVVVQTSSKHRAGIHSMPCDYPRFARFRP